MCFFWCNLTASAYHQRCICLLEALPAQRPTRLVPKFGSGYSDRSTIRVSAFRVTGPNIEACTQRALSNCSELVQISHRDLSVLDRCQTTNGFPSLGRPLVIPEPKCSILGPLFSGTGTNDPSAARPIFRLDAPCSLHLVFGACL